jgi:protocatechuate 3,4-dioxygenase, alpha subunit
VTGYDGPGAAAQITPSQITPSQTVGPFFAIGLPWPGGPHVVAPDAPGACWLRGRVLDGAGAPVPDALVETWQCDPAGRFGTPGFRGFGRCPTDDAGRWAVRTVKPGRVRGAGVPDGPDGGGPAHAPHVELTVFARGLLAHLTTRLYFPDEAAANAADPVLAALDPDRRSTLVATATPDGYALDIHLQGPDETVFFAF